MNLTLANFNEVYPDLVSKYELDIMLAICLASNEFHIDITEESAQKIASIALDKTHDFNITKVPLEESIYLSVAYLRQAYETA